MNNTSRLVLGSAQFGLDYGVANSDGQISENLVGTVLDSAKKSGIYFLDTASAYGSSEEILGSHGARDFSVITKLDAIPKDAPSLSDWMYWEVRESLKKLRIPSLYGLLIHRCQDLFDFDYHEIVHALHEMRSRGLTQKVGVSVYWPHELEELIKLEDFDLVQLPLNPVNQQFSCSGWLQRLQELGIEVHARSIFLQGLLLMSRNQIPSQFERWSAVWNDWNTFCREQDITNLDACLNYAFSFSSVNKVIVGIDSLTQLQAIVDSSKNASKTVAWQFDGSGDRNLIDPSRWEKR
ncbi:aldo/keto reductase [Arenicellales bacterium IMCC55707]|jgi:aryl-alcohol dehydrogenase-like predicted oxidoreductase